MKKSLKVSIIIAVITCIISISGSYAATNYAISATKIGYSDNSNLGATNVQAAIDGTCTKFSEQLKEMKKSIYPVGSIYVSTKLATKEEVATELGGSWEVYGKGKTLIGVDTSDSLFNEVGKTGGSKSNSITLTTDNLPSHIHNISHTHTTSEVTTTTLNLTAEKAGSHSHMLPLLNYGTTKLSRQYNSSWIDNASGEIDSKMYTSSAGEHTHKVSGSVTIPSLTTSTQSVTESGAAGLGKSFSTSTIQPYITVYMYERVS